MPLILVCTTNRQQFRTNVSHYELFAIRFPSHHGRNLLNRATRHGRPNGVDARLTVVPGNNMNMQMLDTLAGNRTGTVSYTHLTLPTILRV